MKTDSQGEDRRKKCVWVKPWVANRLHSSAFGNIFADTWLNDKEESRKYLGTNIQTYQVRVPYFIRFYCYKIEMSYLEKLD